MTAGRTKREVEERKLRIADFKWKVYPLLTNEWQHISKFQGQIVSPLSRDIIRKWVSAALEELKREGRVESMRDGNFPGLYWRKRE
ncbi:hypothetical protein [Methanoregula sp.]|jgi:hypothetical protein|uniref:hypothetical protein n=1 Tax=Methanoregula sp. TaxID=2052170 RepID=UPI003567410A